MAQVEEDLGRDLDSKAVNHYNTDNPHTHIVVSGLDKKNNEVFIDKEYISNGMRGRAVEIATAELGQRQEHDIRRSINKEIKEQKLTGLDRSSGILQDRLFRLNRMLILPCSVLTEVEKWAAWQNLKKWDWQKSCHLLPGVYQRH